jgi:hypothetical protein
MAICFAMHQGFLLVMIAVVAKVVYGMLRIKKIKKIV